MLRLSGIVALTLTLVPILSTFAAPAPCAWPGFTMGNNPWGVVLAPAESSAIDSMLSSANCPSPSISSSPDVVYMTSFTTTTVPLLTSTTISTFETSATFSSPEASPTTFDASTFSSSSTTFEAPVSSSSSDTPTEPPPAPSTTSTSSSETPTTTTFISASPATTSNPSIPSSSSSSSEAPASSPSGNNLNSDSNGSEASDDDVNEYLSTHNTVRAQHGASDLVWNNTLATAAQKWSDGCVFQHSGGSLGPFGENIAAGSGGSYGITSAVTSWTNEASDFNPNSPAASHFTQVVWKATTQLGCALTTCSAGTVFPGNFGSSKYVVCEYFPQGNIINDFAANVQA